MSEKTGFLRNHGDAIAIIASVISVNIAMGAILITLHLSNSAGIAACNARIDATMSRIDGMYEVLMNHVKPKSNNKKLDISKENNSGE